MRFKLSTWLVLALILAAGAALRVWILSSPLGEVEADESVVGLMALHVEAGERPAFYWGQPVLGSLEAYLVAASFALAGPSNRVLKSAAGLVYLAFVVLVYIGAKRDFGERIALFSALYLALPPSFLAFWSLKARGGYVELLALGQALMLMAPWVTGGGRWLPAKIGLSGLVAGLLLWTHPLGLVYVLPVAAFLAARLGRKLVGGPLVAAALGFLLGLAPALAYNVEHDWETLAALANGGSSTQTLEDNLANLVQIGLPVMVGLGQATSSPILFAEDWPHRPGHWPWVAALLLVAVLLALLPSISAASRLLSLRERATGASQVLGLGVLALTPIAASMGRFGELVAEPRYALPLYSAVPLFVAGAAALAGRGRLLAIAMATLAFGTNAYSLATADPRLNLPTTVGPSTEASRAALLEHLSRRGLHEVYADYWLAYPLVFESREQVMASVISGGYNRFPPYAYFVSVSENPAFVFVRDSADESGFQSRLAASGGRAEREWVSIYSVYSGVEPLAAMRP